MCGATDAIMVFGNDTINPYMNTLNYFWPSPFLPFIARWTADCDTNVITSVNQNKKPIAQVNLYPNPSNGIFTIALVGTQNFVSSIRIYDVLGEQILTETLHSVQGDNTINISNQPSGIYFYRVLKETGELLGSGKFVIE